MRLVAGASLPTAQEILGNADELAARAKHSATAPIPRTGVLIGPNAAKAANWTRRATDA